MTDRESPHFQVSDQRAGGILLRREPDDGKVVPEDAAGRAVLRQERLDRLDRDPRDADLVMGFIDATAPEDDEAVIDPLFMVLADHAKEMDSFTKVLVAEHLNRLLDECELVPPRHEAGVTLLRALLETAIAEPEHVDERYAEGGYPVELLTASFVRDYAQALLDRWPKGGFLRMPQRLFALILLLPAGAFLAMGLFFVIPAWSGQSTKSRAWTMVWIGGGAVLACLGTLITGKGRQVTVPLLEEKLHDSIAGIVVVVAMLAIIVSYWLTGTIFGWSPVR